MAGVLHTAPAERAPGLLRLCVHGANWLRYAWDYEMAYNLAFHTVRASLRCAVLFYSYAY